MDKVVKFFNIGCNSVSLFDVEELSIELVLLVTLKAMAQGITELKLGGAL